MEETIEQINSYEYKDKKGKLIGTLKNLNRTYLNLVDSLTIGRGIFEDGGAIDVKDMDYKIDIYKAIRFCSKKTVSVWDMGLNKLMERNPDFADHIGYKPIPIKTDQ